MLINLITFLIGALLFLFLFWKRLKDDYASEIIFKSAFFILLGVFSGWLVISKLFPEWFFWAELVGGITGLSICVYRLKVRFYETLEAFAVSSLPGLSLMFLKDSVVNSSFISFAAFLVVLLIIFVSYFLDLHYKEFSWYKSGKIGFAGLATLGIVFLVRAAIALFRIPVLSFVGKFEAIAAGSLAFLCFLMILNLGRSQ